MGMPYTAALERLCTTTTTNGSIHHSSTGHRQVYTKLKPQEVQKMGPPQSTRHRKAIACLRKCKGQALRVAANKIDGKIDFLAANLDIRSAISMLVAKRFECTSKLNEHENSDF
jgi:hypothetical protein